MAQTLSVWKYPRVIAHRCGGALAPENTLAGLTIASRLGIRAVEFDVMLSQDDVPVLIHDETLERTTSGQGAVNALTAAELQKLDAGSWQHPAFQGTQLPTLLDALQHCQQLALAANIEIKPALGFEALTGRITARVVAEFMASCQQEGKLPPPLLYSSFSLTALMAARKESGEGQEQCKRKAGQDFPLIPCAWLVENIPSDWQAQLQALHCQYLHCDARQLDERTIEALCASGITVACYTVNCTKMAERLFAAGVAAVFSDRIDLFPAETGNS